MTKTLSSELPPSRAEAARAMLVANANANAASNRTTVPGRPTPRRLWPRPLLIGAALAAAVGVTAAAVVLNGEPRSTTLASASWTATPQMAPPPDAPDDDVDQWASKCTDLGTGGLGVQGVPADRDGADAREVLVDRRGDVTFCLDVSLGTATPSDPLIALAGFVVTGGRDEGLGGAGGTVYDQLYDRPTGGEVLVLGGDTRPHPAEPDRDPNTRSFSPYMLYGIAGDDVTGVDIVLTNGLRITTSMRDGTWGAWWPKDKGDPTGVHLDVRTTDGIRTVDPARAGLDWDRE